MRMGRVSFGKGIMPERMAWVITLGGWEDWGDWREREEEGSKFECY